jgi:iron complex transport system ATP-binding protein
MSYIKLTNTYFSYSNNNREDILFTLDDINLGIEKQEFISILGPNGSGKTTLLKIIAGILYPSRGSITIKNNEYEKLSRKELSKVISYVPLSVQSVFPFSIYEIVMMGRTPFLNMFGFESNKDKEIVEEALELVEISHLKNHGINEVSGGEAQRAFLARAIAQNPEIVLLDEPSSHLDIKHQLSIFNLLKKLNTENKLTVVVVLHDLNIAAYYSSRVILMKNGKIFKDGSNLDTLTEDNIQDVFEVKASVKVESEKGIVNVLVKP